MNLWDTNSGDKWLCPFCEDDLKDTIQKEKWRLVFQKFDPELRCSECSHSDMNIDD